MRLKWQPRWVETRRIKSLRTQMSHLYELRISGFPIGNSGDFCIIEESLEPIIQKEETMTLQECYEAMGGDYEDVMARLRKPERVEKFLLKFPEDGSFDNLRKAMEQGNQEEAFRASHSIKGVSQNMGFTRLFQSSHELTEAVRPGQGSLSDPLISTLLAKVTEDYRSTLDAIQKFKDECESQKEI